MQQIWNLTTIQCLIFKTINCSSLTYEIISMKWKQINLNKSIEIAHNFKKYFYFLIKHTLASHSHFKIYIAIYLNHYLSKQNILVSKELHLSLNIQLHSLSSSNNTRQDLSRMEVRASKFLLVISPIATRHPNLFKQATAHDYDLISITFCNNSYV